LSGLAELGVKPDSKSDIDGVGMTILSCKDVLLCMKRKTDLKKYWFPEVGFICNPVYLAKWQE
jgi:hypothetical protein